MKDRICDWCGKNYTYIKKDGIHDWRNIGGKPWCKSCHKRIFENPIHNPIYNKKWSPINNRRKVLFKERYYYVPEKPRTGQCRLCKKSIGDEYINCFGEIAEIKQTHLHHINYHDTDILKDTFELCASCHAKVSNKKIVI